jgi:hypothetical protein
MKCKYSDEPSSDRAGRGGMRRRAPLQHANKVRVARKVSNSIEVVGLRRFVIYSIIFLSSACCSLHSEDNKPFVINVNSPSLNATSELRFDLFGDIIEKFSNPRDKDFENMGLSFLGDIKTITVEDMLNGFDSDISDLILSLDFRGLEMSITYPNVSGNTVILGIPTLGINKTFSEASRTASFTALGDYLANDNNNIFNDIMKKLAHFSPIDPFAGNPSSIMSKMVAHDYTIARKHPQNIDEELAEGNRNFFGFETSRGEYYVGRFEESTYTVLGSWTRLLKGNYLKKVIVEVPVHISSVGKAKSYAASFAGALTIAKTEKWNITPVVRVGGGGSSDLAGGGVAASGSVVSDYRFERGSWTVFFHNMAGCYSSFPVTLGEVDLNPEIIFCGFKNGISFQHDITIRRRKLIGDLSLALTNFIGSPLYSQYYLEAGGSLQLAPNSKRRFVKNGKVFVDILTGDNSIHGYKVGISCDF